MRGRGGASAPLSAAGGGGGGGSSALPGLFMPFSSSSAAARARLRRRGACRVAPGRAEPGRGRGREGEPGGNRRGAAAAGTPRRETPAGRAVRVRGRLPHHNAFVARLERETRLFPLKTAPNSHPWLPRASEGPSSGTGGLATSDGVLQVFPRERGGFAVGVLGDSSPQRLQVL